MAEHGGRPTRLDRGEETAFERHARMADGEHAPVQAMQAPVADAHRDRVPRQSARLQLGERQHAPRLGGAPSDQHIGSSVEFVCLGPTKSTLDAFVHVRRLPDTCARDSTRT